MSIVTTITNLISYEYPENAYVRFFGRVLDYDLKSATLTIQEIPTFYVNTKLVSSSLITQKDSSTIWRMQPPPANLPSSPGDKNGLGKKEHTHLQRIGNWVHDYQELPIALVHIKDELIPEAGLTLSHDIIKSCLIVDVMARLRARGEEKEISEYKKEDNDGSQDENDNDDDTIRDSDTSIVSSNDEENNSNSSSSIRKNNSSSSAPHCIDVDYISVSKLDDQALFDDANSEVVEAFLKKVCFVRESISTKQLHDL